MSRQGGLASEHRLRRSVPVPVRSPGARPDGWQRGPMKKGVKGVAEVMGGQESEVQLV